MSKPRPAEINVVKEQIKTIVTWLKKRKVSDWFFVLIVMFVLITRLPTLIEQYGRQGTKLIPIVLDGKLFPPPGTKSVFVFWASWCGPCTIELKRIQGAIEDQEISSKNIFAVNLGESQEVVNKVAKERKFNMPVILDEKSALANILNVRVTPTVVFIDEKGKIDWISSGLSPSLIYRIKYFLKD